MTADQLAALRAIMDANRQPIFRGEQYAHPRGWNDALEFIETTIKRITGQTRTEGEGDKST